jgi:hypothetical protein
MKYAVDRDSGGMTTGSVIQVVLRLSPQKFERLQCWYYGWAEFMKHVAEISPREIL